ncbi:UNVERIFIED_ORG: hypothetical protein M2328_005741 [Rhodococcus erythropolis]
MSDHKSAAKEYLDVAETCIHGYQHLSVSNLIAMAQVHATLATTQSADRE